MMVVLCVLSHRVTTGYTEQPNTGNVVRVTEQFNFFIVFNFSLYLILMK